MNKVSLIESFVYSSNITAELHHFQNASPSPLRTHMHDTYQLGITIRNPGRYYVGSNFYTVKRGNFFCFHPHTPHASIGNISRNVLEKGFTVYISKELFSFYNKMFFKENGLPFFSRVFYSDANIIQCFKSFFTAVWSNSVNAEQHLQKLFCMIMKLHDSYTIKNKGPVVIQTVQQYISDNLFNKISLQEIASKNNMSVSKLNRMFQKDLGITPYAYINQLRIHQTKQLLRQNLTLKEISALTNHHDESHFRKNFKMYIGVSPNSYKIIR